MSGTASALALVETTTSRKLDDLLDDLSKLAKQRVLARRVAKSHGRRPIDPQATSRQILALRDLVTPSVPPRHHKAFDAIARRFREIGFTWEPATSSRMVDEKDRHGVRTGKQVEVMHSFIRFMHYPLLRGEFPTLAELLELDLSVFDQYAPKVQKRVQPLVNIGPVGKAFAETLLRLPISLPPTEVMEAVKVWLGRALAGEPSTIFSPVCPDYEIGPDGRYTFDTLRDGVGLVARRVQLALPALWQFCQAYRLPVTFVVAMGDSEAENPANCARVGLTRDEFIARLRGSQQSFRSSTSPDIPLDVPMVTETGPWHETVARARVAAEAGNFTGALALDPDDFQAICDARESLYRRWYGGEVDVLTILRGQAPEYMAMATMATARYPNTLILGGDAPSMGPFFQGLGDRIRPVLYLQGVRY